MSRNYFILFLLSTLCLETAAAKSMVDCRVAISGITECNPYGAKFLKAKEMKHEVERKRLIRVKILPVPKKKRSLKVVSVEEMIEKYENVEESVRFKGSEKTLFSVTVDEEPVDQEELEEIIKEIQVCKVPLPISREILEQTDTQKPEMTYGKYIVVRGDALSKLAKKFGMKTKELAKFNGIKSKSTLCIGQELQLPFAQKIVDSLISAEYKVGIGDTLIGIAKKFNLDPKALAKFNDIKTNTAIRTGKILKLPLPYVMAQKKKVEARKRRLAAKQESGKVDLRGFGKRQLRITATAYTSHADQTDGSPFVGAWNNRLRPGMKVIAVSRDLLKKYGMRNGTRVRIGGLPGYYTVRDKMNKRYKKRIDVYMGLDRRKALRWGRRSVMIYW